MENSMPTMRSISLGAALGVALLASASPASAYIVEALTFIPATAAHDKTELETAVRMAVVDVATHAVAFVPAVVSIREIRLVGDRIYLFVLLADEAGAAEVETLKAEPSEADF